MIKNFLIISILFFFTSCSNWANEELKTSGKANSASSRINASESSSKNILKDLE